MAQTRSSAPSALTGTGHERPYPDMPYHDMQRVERDDRTPAKRQRSIVQNVALLVPLQLFLAAGWLRAGVEKVIDPDWWSGRHLVVFLDEQQLDMLPFFTPFANDVVSPLTVVVSWLVLAMQLMIAICLISNRHVKPALWAGIVLNVCFTMAGRVNPSAFYLIMEITLLFARSRPVDQRIAVRRAVLWLVPAIVVAPFATTLHPATVIDDPALMLSFVALTAAITTVAVTIPLSQLVEKIATHGIARRTARLLGLDQSS